MNEFENDIISMAKKTALISFILGSVIFVVFLFSNIETITYIAILFVFIATITNAIILLQLAYIWFLKVERRKEIRNVIFLVLINIPIALIFMKIGGSLFRDRFGF